MKRKTSQKALSSQTLSARLEAWKRSDLSSTIVIVLFSYLVKFLGTLTRVVKLNHTTLGLLQTTTRYRAVPQSYC